MGKALVKLPVGMAYGDGLTEVECEGATVGEVLHEVVAVEPRLKARIFNEDGSIWVGVFVNGRNMRQLQALDTPIADGDKIMVVPPISGG
jgi:molybdopterin synthase sulfur carrier subunit